MKGNYAAIPVDQHQQPPQQHIQQQQDSTKRGSGPAVVSVNVAKILENIVAIVCPSDK